MLKFIKQTYIVLLLLLLGFGRSLATKCPSMNNQPCTPRLSLIDLNPDELPYYPFMVSLDMCAGSCSTVEGPFGRICVPNKIEDVNLNIFDIIKKINESKT